MFKRTLVKEALLPHVRKSFICLLKIPLYSYRTLVLHYIFLSLLYNTIYLLFLHLIILCIILKITFVSRVAQPVFLGKLVEYYTPKQKSVDQNEAYMYAGAVVLCSALNVFVVHPYMMAILHMGMKFRVACCSLIYRKVINIVDVFNYYFLPDCTRRKVMITIE